MLLWFHWQAVLVSYLSIRKTILPFSSLEELVNNGQDFRLAVNPGTSLMDNFKYATEDTWQKAWKGQIEPHVHEYIAHKESKKNMIDYLMENNKVALYQHYPTTSTYPEFLNCEIIAIPGKYNFKPFAFGFQKDSPYQGLFDFYVKEMIEKGITKQILDRYQTADQVCPDLSGSSLGFESCFPAFLALIIGMILGLLFISVEIVANFFTLDMLWNRTFENMRRIKIFRF